MAAISAISWTDSTQNFWLGCTKISPACDHCYAETWAKRAGMGDLWQGRRQRTKTWGEPLKWQKKHIEFFSIHGHRRRVFTNSLADFFDNEVEDGWRDDAWAVIHQCPDLDWLIVTKRIGNVERMLPKPGFGRNDFGHVILIITVVNQSEANRDIPKLVALKARYPWLRIGLSIEPMVGPIILSAEWLRTLDWVIVGGESGAEARAMPFLWVIALRDACSVYGVPFHFKQIGHNHDGWNGLKLTGKGDDPAEWPEEIRCQEFPREMAA